MEENKELIINDKKDKWNKIGFIIILVLSSLLMLFFIGKKEGWHCDEIFSYGSANCYFENTLHPYGEKDSTRIFLEEKVFNGNLGDIIKNLKYYYIDHTDERDKIIGEHMAKEIPTWRSREAAIDYIEAGNNRFNYASVYYNQLRDVHPPLFYMLVHTVSSIFNNTFSKYIIFFISLPFFLGTCYFIRKILILIDRKEISLIAVVLYAFSMGAISTMMFQRMYMMLTFFSILYLYLFLLIRKNDYNTTFKIRLALFFTTVLGFLTQYYFCIYAALVTIVMCVVMIIKKKYKELFKIIGTLVISAVVGLLIFPFAIEHMFFSYRGVSSFGNGDYLSRLVQFGKYILEAFGSTTMIALALLILALFANIIKRKKEWDMLFLVIAPAIVYVFIIAKICPFLELRYIMNVLPIIAIMIVMVVSGIFENRAYNTIVVSVVVALLTIYGLVMLKPMFLYEGYQEYIDISKKYSEDSYVFVGYTFFNHIQSVPEFMNYKQTLMLSTDQLDLTKDNQVLNESNEFILSINKYLGADEILNTIMQNTGYSNYEVLTYGCEGVDNIIYRVYR